MDQESDCDRQLPGTHRNHNLNNLTRRTKQNKCIAPNINQNPMITPNELRITKCIPKHLRTESKLDTNNTRVPTNMVLKPTGKPRVAKSEIQ